MPVPPFKKNCPCTILPFPFFLIFRFPPPGEVIKIYSPLFKKGGLWITWYSSRNCTSLVLNLANNSIYLKTASLFQSCVLLLSCRQSYFSLHDDYPPLIYTMQSIYIAALPFLINWNDKQCSESNILTMDHKVVLENPSSAAVNTLPNTIWKHQQKIFHHA